MELQKLSPKSFIGDLPRVINTCFEAIENAFNTIYDNKTNVLGNDKISVKCKSISAGGEIYSSKDVKVNIDGTVISLLDLYNRVQTLEQEKEEPILSKSLLAKKKLQ